MSLRPLVAMLLSAACLPAQAQLARQFSSATYTGIGGAQASSDFDNLDPAINLDAVGGFRITPALGWGSLAAELNLSVTVSPGENQGQPSAGVGGGLIGGGGGSDTSCGRCSADPDDLAMQNFSLLGVYRSPGRLYGLGLAGYAISSTSIEEIEEASSGGFSYGGGLGFRFGENTAAVELIYQQISEELHTIAVRLLY